MTERTFLLDADSLMSKWGFGDGDSLDDWWWDQFDEAFPDEASDHDVLRDLVRTHLVPAVEAAGHTIRVFDIETIHNPIRAAIIDDNEIDDYGETEFHPPIYVEVSEDEIRAAIKRVALRLNASTNGEGHA